MAVDIGVLRGRIELEDRFSPALTQASTQLTDFGKKMESVGDRLSSVGQTMSMAVTLPIVGMGAAIVSVGTEFEGAMNQIQGVLSPTADQMEVIRAKAMEMGAATVFSATDAGTAILELGKAGLSTEESISAVDETMQLAAASGLEMGRAAEMSARTMNMFGLEVDDLAHLNDVLAAAVNSTSLEIGDLEVAFRYIGPVANVLGMSVEQVSAALGIMRDQGIAAETAGRAMREGLTRLINPTKQVQEVMTELGLNFKDAHGNLIPFDEVIQQLEPHAKDAGAMMKLFGDAAGGPFIALVGEGSEALRDMTASFESAEGNAKAMADAMMTGLPGAIEEMKGSIETALVALSGALEPAILSVTGAIGDMADWVANVAVPAWKEMDEGLQMVILAVVGLAAAAGPALMAVGTAVKLAGIAFTGWGAAIKVVEGMKAAILSVNAAAGASRAAIGLMTGALAGIVVPLALDQLLKLFNELKKTIEASKGWRLDALSENATHLKTLAEASRVAGREINNLDEAHRILRERINGMQGAFFAQNANLDALKNGSIRVVTSLEDLNVSNGKVETSLKKVAEETTKATAPVQQMSESLKTLIDDLGPSGALKAAKDWELAVKAIGGVSKLTKEDQDRYRESLLEVIDAYKAAEGPNSKMVQHFIALAQTIPIPAKQLSVDLMLGLNGAVGATNLLIQAMQEAKTTAIGLTKDGLIPATSVMHMQTLAGKELQDVMVQVAGIYVETERASEKLKQSQPFGDQMRDNLQDISNILDGINNQFAQMAAVVIRTADAIMKNLAEGDWVGAIIAGVTGIATAIGNLFSKSAAKKLNDQRDAFIKEVFGNTQNMFELAIKFQITEADIKALFDARNTEAFERAMERINAQIGMMEARVEEFKSTFPELLDQLASSGALASETTLQMMQRLQEAGLMTEELLAFQTGQLSMATEGLNAYLGTWLEGNQSIVEKEQELADLRSELAGAEGDQRDKILADMARVQGEIDKQRVLTEALGVTTQANFNAMTGAVMGTFNAMVEGGMTSVEALAALEPSINALSMQMQEMGFTGNAAFDMIRVMSEMAGDEIAGPAIEAVLGLNEAMVGLHNTGLMDQDMFAGLTSQIAHTFTTLVAQGYNGDAALRMMQPSLQTIWELQQDFGYATDEATQAMLEQAIAAGIVGDEHRDAQERIAVAMENVAELLEDFIRMMTYDLPDAAHTAKGAILDMAGAVPSQVTIGVGWNVDDFPNLNVPDGAEIHGMAEGGFGRVTGPTLFLAGEAGPEEFAFSGAGKSFGSLGGDQTINVNLDGMTIARAAARNMPRVLSINGVG